MGGRKATIFQEETKRKVNNQGEKVGKWDAAERILFNESNQPQMKDGAIFLR